MAEVISGEPPEALLALAQERGGRLWLPFEAGVAEALIELSGARMDHRALRCAQRIAPGGRHRASPLGDPFPLT